MSQAVCCHGRLPSLNSKRLVKCCGTRQIEDWNKMPRAPPSLQAIRCRECWSIIQSKPRRTLQQPPGCAVMQNIRLSSREPLHCCWNDVERVLVLCSIQGSSAMPSRIQFCSRFLGGAAPASDRLDAAPACAGTHLERSQHRLSAKTKAWPQHGSQSTWPIF